MKRSLITILITVLVIFITGCASVPMPTQEGSLPPQMKSVDYYKTHLNDVIKKAEATGDPDTQVELAFAYGNTWYGVQDLEKHLYWVKKAADQNNLPALCAMSYKHYTGDGVPNDITLADSLVDKAYNIYLSKSKPSWSKYDTYMISGALKNRGVYAKTKEESKRYICLARSLNSDIELRIYSIGKAMREKKIICD